MSRRASVTGARQRKPTNAILALGNGKNSSSVRTSCILRRRTAIPPRLSTSCYQLAQSRKLAQPQKRRSMTGLGLNVAPGSPAGSCRTGGLSQPRCMSKLERVTAPTDSQPHCMTKLQRATAPQDSLHITHAREAGAEVLQSSSTGYPDHTCPCSVSLSA